MKQKTELEKVKKENDEKMLELENIRQHVYVMQELFNRRDNEMKTMYLEKIGLIKEMALLAPRFKDDLLKSNTDEEKLIRKMHDIVKKLNSQKFTEIANELYPNFTEKLKKLCGELDDKEICICCLILFDFNNEELNLFLNHRLKGSLNTIQNKKSAIRRKLNIPPYGDVKNYLENL